ncbi:MAG: hypothetical protein HOL01_10330 [Planctomycetaceae bacterium]|jgi:phage shock protein A|nr:hypothetical protein [Planctomycetaceae bacterium]MBT6483840.1 hypothetical protein [Planctomycetaceae bacterium]MBT6494937.1 hypothetical protein [Planctomycetaceae bacterium]
MGLFKRIGDIISANLGEMAEDFEDPEKMLKQAVHEMDESIRQATQEPAKTLAGEKRLVKELARNESEAKRNLAMLSARKKAADVRKKLYTASTEPREIGLDDLAFEKFDRMQDEVEQAEAEAEALAELQGSDTGNSSSDFDDVGSGSTDIEAELEKLKQSKQKP